MSDRYNEALEAAADKLRVRACGYLARYDTIYNGRIVSEELFGLAEAIFALREADPVHPSAKPFKCPHCGSHCFGPTWRGKELAGRYCKGWPSDEDRSYRQCPAKYVEWYGQADQRVAAGGCVTSGGSATESTDRPVAPHHPGALWRKRPVVVSASQWWKHGDHPAVIERSGVPWVPTLENGHVVTPGDWIITGVKGEHYPCKPDVFAATYESFHPGGHGHESSRSQSEDSSARESVADSPASSGPCVVVPVKPTEKMLAAANRAYGEYESTHMTRSNAWNQWRHIYAAMLAAAEEERNET